MKPKRCLLVKFRSYKYYDDISRACVENGLEVAAEYCETHEDLTNILALVNRFHPDFILCHPVFSPYVSRMGSTLSIPVFHWLVDKMIEHDRWPREMFADNDYVFCTYTEDVAYLKRIGVRSEYFLNVCNITPVDHVSVEKKYGVTFVGTIELGENNYYRQFISEMKERFVDSLPEIQLLADRLMHIFSRILNLQSDASKKFQYILPELSERVTQYIRSIDSVFHGFAAINIPALLAKEVAFMQRQYFFQAIPHLDVFGPADWAESDMPNIHYHGLCDQYKDSGRVFAESRINLSISRIYSLDGLSDRIFNVLFARGFLLANRQETLSQVFREGVDLEMYANVDELLDKIRFYENNPLARERIARQGYENVIKNHTFTNRIGEIVSLLQR
ncbi:MAG: glycosyltransferase family 1 protein [Magnetococcales bacterium]|nr:glycosyltransferase family 1 protein [Magnetococcales bacterium]MBF0321860.1 glycosyltransferase family 1 protein [Magnetococcales bacterium]